VEEQTVLRTTTDSNGNYIFEAHPDGDGTTQDYHVSCYNYDGTAYVNSNDNPGVSAALPSNAIPDSVVEQFSAQSAFTSAQDGTVVSNWPGELGTYTATGSGTVRENGINGNRAVEIDNTNDHFSVSSSTFTNIPIPFTVIAVVEANFSNNVGENRIVFHRASGESNFSLLGWSETNEWEIFDETNRAVFGSSTVSRQLLTGVYQSSASIREDGTETGTGTMSDPLTSLCIGSLDSGTRFSFGGNIGFLEVHDGLPSNGLANREAQVAALFNITL